MKNQTPPLLLAIILSLQFAACTPKISTPSNIASDEQLNRGETLIADLGRKIFTDRRLSEPQGMACASCHNPAQAFTGNNGSSIAGVAAGALPNTFGNRNSPTAMYAQFSPEFNFSAELNDVGLTEYTPNGGQFWDGRATNLAEQAKGPFLNAREMNNPSKASVVDKIAEGPYAEQFLAVFGSNAFAFKDKAYDQVAEAISAFEHSAKLAPFKSKFDAVLQGQEQFTELEAQGFALFQDPEKGNCIACHAGNQDSKKPSDWLFTDFTYDNLGVPRNSEIIDNRDPSHFDLGLCQQSGLAGRMPQGFDLDSVCGAFKVPTLRNIALTGPYMHNGSFKSLRAVVKFYVTRETNPDFWYPSDETGKILKYNDLPETYQKNVNVDEVPYDRKLGEQPRLDDSEIDAVVAFLQTLTDR